MSLIWESLSDSDKESCWLESSSVESSGLDSRFSSGTKITLERERRRETFWFSKILLLGLISSQDYLLLSLASSRAEGSLTTEAARGVQESGPVPGKKTARLFVSVILDTTALNID